MSGISSRHQGELAPATGHSADDDTDDDPGQRSLVVRQESKDSEALCANRRITNNLKD